MDKPSYPVMAFRLRPALIRIERMEQALAVDALHKHQLVDLLCMSWKQVSNYVNYLHQQTPKRIYIKKWIFREGRYIACYRRGDRPDAKKPLMTNKEKITRYVNKQKQEGVYEIKRAKRVARQRKPKQDDLMLAFFGKELKSKPDPT